VSSCQSVVEPAPILPVGETCWFAIQTIARHEKRVVGHFREQQISTFLPLLKQLHQWSDRRMQIQVPLFSCYVFVRISQQRQIRDRILRTPGVLGFVGGQGRGASIPNQQVEAIQRILEEDVPFGFHPFLEVGNRVRLRGGALDGIEGILVVKNRDQSVVVSVELLKRSLSLRVEGYGLEPV
jgi:transcription antitermination factor NusG